MGNETDCMVGNPGIPVLADLVLKGYVKDKEGAYEAMKQSALRDDRGLGLLKKYGICLTTRIQRWKQWLRDWSMLWQTTVWLRWLACWARRLMLSILLSVSNLSQVLR